MTAHQPNTTASTPMGNARAEAIFIASNVPDNERNRRAIRADAHYTMNHVGMRYSEAIHSACQAFPRLASPLALAILADDAR